MLFLPMMVPFCSPAAGGALGGRDPVRGAAPGRPAATMALTGECRERPRNRRMAPPKVNRLPLFPYCPVPLAYL